MERQKKKKMVQMDKSGKFVVDANGNKRAVVQNDSGQPCYVDENGYI